MEEVKDSSMNLEQELNNYVEDGLKKGYTKDEIRKILLEQGFAVGLVEKILGRTGGSGRAKRIFIWVLIIILILGIVGAGGYFGWRYWSDIGGAFTGNNEAIGNNVNENLIDNSFVGQEESIVDEAVSNGDYSVCNREQDEKEKLGCRINVAVSLGEAEFCRGDLDSSITFGYYIGGEGAEDTVYLGAKDYCWAYMSAVTRIDYCDSLSTEGYKEICRRVYNENIA